MTLRIRKMDGPFFTLEVSPLCTVGILREALGEVLGSMEGQRMSFDGRQLEQDDRLLVTYGVNEGSAVVVVGP
jgi:hypothetical protein